ncbi:hypothetical protein BU17DRAFT_44111 [Hysterangium stoloniferum]|nr:hypothetical protein BU17DRAFT_44111 [Hysterangium stoloniferum]
MEAFRRKTGKITRLPDETPEHFLGRLLEHTSRAEVAHVLASSGEEFYSKTLNLYLSRFNFVDDPLDVALRRLLMEIGLPRETQQIDRVMEAFAARYITCNSNLFVDKDHPYILAFSLIMLHTDAFNKSNKNKMTKADYVKNTKIPGVPPEILECFFDNIVFAPFIFIEDPMDGHSTAKNYLPEGSSRISTISGPIINSPGGINATGTSTLLGKTNKIDPYYLITQDLLGPLRADVVTHIPKSNPFLYEGTDWPWDTQRLHHLFALARILYVHPDTSGPVTPITGPPSGLATPGRRKSIVMSPAFLGYGNFMALKIVKAGGLIRKDDTIEGGKRSTNRKWREWSVVLTSSQLLFFRDLSFASHLLDLSFANGTQQSDADEALLNPDDVVHLYECIAVYDTTYTKYPHTFRFFMPNGRQFIMQAPNEQSLNDWISTINYASAFVSAGVGMRGLGMSHKEVEMTGVAAATSHLKDLMSARVQTTPPEVSLNGADTSRSNADREPSWLSSPESPLRQGSASKLLRSFHIMPNQVDLETPLSSQIQDSRQFKATFEEVKAELAAQTTNLSSSRPSGRSRTLSMGTRSTPSPRQNVRPSTAGSSIQSEDLSPPVSPLPRSRADVIQTRVDLLDARVSRIQRELDEELRVARNLAILTPFQRTTRDRVQLGIVPLTKKIKSMRIDLAKCQCYRFVLLSDMAEEERQWERVKRDALHAATRRLSIAEPRLSPKIDKHMDIHREPSTSWSTTDSFHTAIDIDPKEDYPESSSPTVSSHGSRRPSRLHTNFILNSLTPTQSPMDTSFDGSSPIVDGHERFYTAIETAEEIAEEWNETRAAKRVSLVRVPSHVKLTILGRQLRSGSVLNNGPSLEHSLTDSS